MRVYFDNAASTPLDHEVFEEMKPFLIEKFGNPSSIHGHGREVKAAVEKARKTVAEILNVSPSEIFFTSGGTESDNTILTSSVLSGGIRHIISSPLEHHAVLHTLDYLKKKEGIQVTYLKPDSKGRINLEELEEKSRQLENHMICLMHGNNEIGNLNDIREIGEISARTGALFHSDTVQTVGHFNLDLQDISVDFIAGSAHKFHGPKGTGFMYISGERNLEPFIHGGAQERNMRGGTENVAGIIGLAKALEKAVSRMEEDKSKIASLKSRLVRDLKEKVPDVQFNGNCLDEDNSLYTVLNVAMPSNDVNEMLLFNLDINNISTSAGSACSSGSDIGSHVLNYLQADPGKGHIRFSLGRQNTEEEVNYVVEKLSEMYN